MFDHGLEQGYVLPDLLAPKLKIIFIGTAASAMSAKTKSYYAHPGNLFWPTLHKVGLTPRQFAPAEFPQLLDLGIGLTDIAKTATGSDAQIPDDAWNADAVLDKIRRWQPRYVGFTSKAAATLSLGLKKVAYGLIHADKIVLTKNSSGMMPQGLGETGLFVLPSPSGRARGYWDETWWAKLARLCDP